MEEVVAAEGVAAVQAAVMEVEEVVVTVGAALRLEGRMFAVPPPAKRTM